LSIEKSKSQGPSTAENCLKRGNSVPLGMTPLKSRHSLRIVTAWQLS
jgi:hypothetical protein